MDLHSELSAYLLFWDLKGFQVVTNDSEFLLKLNDFAAQKMIIHYSEFWIGKI